uniref:Secreted protein n=1 Tax=Plectus sambesii TaxID=2011161 RepID=A0A914W6Y6_9BILA
MSKFVAISATCAAGASHLPPRVATCAARHNGAVQAHVDVVGKMLIGLHHCIHYCIQNCILERILLPNILRHHIPLARIPEYILLPNSLRHHIPLVRIVELRSRFPRIQSCIPARMGCCIRLLFDCCSFLSERLVISLSNY